jgi:hypothetical protein
MLASVEKHVPLCLAYVTNIIYGYIDKRLGYIGTAQPHFLVHDERRIAFDQMKPTRSDKSSAMHTMHAHCPHKQRLEEPNKPRSDRHLLARKQPFWPRRFDSFLFVA